MYIVNTTFIVEQPVHDRWYDWFTTKVIPHLRREGFHGRMVFTRVLTDGGDPHHTYSLQVHVDDMPSYQRFANDLMGEYAMMAGTMFGEQALHFTTLLKKITLDEN